MYASPRSPLLLMSPDDSESADRLSVSSQLRKTKSMDASCLDVRSINDMTAAGPSTPKPLSRARSEFNLAASSHSLAHGKSPLTQAHTHIYINIPLILFISHLGFLIHTYNFAAMQLTFSK